MAQGVKRKHCKHHVVWISRSCSFSGWKSHLTPSCSKQSLHDLNSTFKSADDICFDVVSLLVFALYQQQHQNCSETSSCTPRAASWGAASWPLSFLFYQTQDSRMHNKTLKRTRKFVVDGVEVSVTTSKIISEDEKKDEEMRFLRQVGHQCGREGRAMHWAVFSSPQANPGVT